MKNILIILFLVSSFKIYSQNAEFTANLNKLLQILKPGEELYEKALKWEWKINGKTLKFGSEAVIIKPNQNSLDTVLFRKNETTKYDTILSNISDPYKYNFEYNPCCDYFRVREMSGLKKTREKSVVSFQISNKKLNKKYLGIIGDAGILIEKENKKYELFHTCSSAMSSNIYRVSLNEVQECKKETNCMELMCIFENNRHQVPFANLYFKIVSEKFSFLYLPLGMETLQIRLDLKRNKLQIKNLR